MEGNETGKLPVVSFKAVYSDNSGHRVAAVWKGHVGADEMLVKTDIMYKASRGHAKLEVMIPSTGCWQPFTEIPTFRLQMRKVNGYDDLLRVLLERFVLLSTGEDADVVVVDEPRKRGVY